MNEGAVRSDANKETNRSVIVRFSSITVHEFEAAIGDNPPSCGAPITLALKPFKSKVYDLACYERNRGYLRSGRMLCLSWEERERKLLDAGFRQREIASAVRAARILRHERQRSYDNQKWDGIHETLEETARKLKKLVTLDLGRDNSPISEPLSPPHSSKKRTTGNGKKMASFASTNSTSDDSMSNSTSATSQPNADTRRWCSGQPKVQKEKAPALPPRRKSLSDQQVKPRDSMPPKSLRARGA